MIVVVLVANVVGEWNQGVVYCLFPGCARYQKIYILLVASCLYQACKAWAPGWRQSDDIHRVCLWVTAAAPEHQCCFACSYCCLDGFPSPVVCCCWGTSVLHPASDVCISHVLVSSKSFIQVAFRTTGYEENNRNKYNYSRLRAIGNIHSTGIVTFLFLTFITG